MPLSRKGLKEKSERGNRGHQWRDGDNIVRILPTSSRYFTESVNDFAEVFFVHYDLGPEGSPAPVCPRSFDDKAECPACAKARQLYRLKTNKEAQEVARVLARSVRFKINLLDVEKPENGVEHVEIGKKIYEPIKAVALEDPSEDAPDIMDIVEGRNFRVNFTPANNETGGYNSYVVTPSTKTTNIKPILSKIPGWKEKLDQLKDSIPKPPSVEDLRKMVDAVAGDFGGSIESTPPTHVRVTKASTGDEFREDSGAAGAAVVRQGSSGSARDEFKDPPPQQEEKADPPQQEEAAAGEDCFGKEYQPHKQRCKECGRKDECMEAFTA